MSELKICRICLRTEAKAYNFYTFQLLYYYEEVMALKVNSGDGLPQYFCYECATLLHKFHKFKEKCYRGHKVLKEMLWKSPITYEDIYKIDRKALDLSSSLEVLKVNENVKAFVTDDSIESAELDNVKEENDLECDEENFDDNIPLDDNEEEKPELDYEEKDDEDEKPLVQLADEKIEVEENSLGSPSTVFVDDNKEIVKLKNHCVKKLRHKTITVTDTPKKNKVRAKKPFKLLDRKHWKKICLSEEEAVKEFRARAEDSKYKAAKFKCTDCFKGFSKQDMLTRHIQLRHTEGPTECRFCRMRFRLDCFLRKHLLQHYTKYECLRCNLICCLENTALMHDDYHNGITQKCVQCNIEFKHMSTYYTHLRTHRSEFVCTMCGASFVSGAGLNQHKKVKHVDLDIESPDDDEAVDTYCVKCDITFETRKAYLEHYFHSAMHADGVDEELEDHLKPRKILGKREKSRISKGLPKKRKFDGDIIMPLKKRVKKYRKLPRKPMDCHQCGKHFETQAACMRHHLAEHPRTSFFPPNERHICEICGASLAPGSVAMHQNIHSRSKMFSCDTCGRTFHSSVGLKRHHVTHTGEKPYACTLCDKRFTQSNSMKLHVKTVHLKQPYPKRNRRYKKGEPHTAEAEDSKTDESSEDSLPDRRLTQPEIEATTVGMQEEHMHYLTLS